MDSKTKIENIKQKVLYEITEWLIKDAGHKKGFFDAKCKLLIKSTVEQVRDIGTPSEVNDIRVELRALLMGVWERRTTLMRCVDNIKNIARTYEEDDDADVDLSVSISHVIDECHNKGWPYNDIEYTLRNIYSNERYQSSESRNELKLKKQGLRSYTSTDSKIQPKHKIPWDSSQVESIKEIAKIGYVILLGPDSKAPAPGWSVSDGLKLTPEGAEKAAIDGRLLGVMPCSINLVIIDIDNGGELCKENVINLLGPPIKIIHSLSSTPENPRYHLCYAHPHTKDSTVESLPSVYFWEGLGGKGEIRKGTSFTNEKEICYIGIYNPIALLNASYESKNAITPDFLTLIKNTNHVDKPYKNYQVTTKFNDEPTITNHPSDLALAKKLDDIIEETEGAIPDLVDEVIKMQFGTDQNKLWKECNDRGILIIDKNYHPKTMAKCLNHVGFEIEYSSMFHVFRIRHPKLLGWEKWCEIKPNKEHISGLTRARNMIFQTCAHIATDSKDNVSLMPIKSTAWGAGVDSLYLTLTSLEGEYIPVRNELGDWAEEKIQDLDKIDEETKKEMDEQLSEVFTNIPGLKPQKGHEKLAAHAGRYIYSMIGHRILQSHPRYQKGGDQQRRPRTQRETPVIVGKRHIGKSTICELILPMGSEKFGTGKIQMGDDTNKMGRRCLGNLLMVFNEMAGVKYNTSSTQIIKGFLTEPSISVDRKFRDDMNIPMPCVFISTANEIKLPSDEALQLRFMFFELIQYNDARVEFLSPEEKALKVSEYFEQNRDKWMITGLHNAIRNCPIEAPEEWIGVRKSVMGQLSHPDSDCADIIRTMIESGEWQDKQGNPFITPAQVAWQCNWLKWPCDVGMVGEAGYRKMGSVIFPTDEVSYYHIKAAWEQTRKTNKHILSIINTGFDQFEWTKGTTAQDAPRRTPMGYDRIERGWIPSQVKQKKIAEEEIVPF